MVSHEKFLTDNGYDIHRLAKFFIINGDLG